MSIPTMLCIPGIGRLRPVPVLRKVIFSLFSSFDSTIASAASMIVRMVMFPAGKVGRSNLTEKRSVWYGMYASFGSLSRFIGRVLDIRAFQNNYEVE